MNWLRSRRPSPALLISLIALFVALGGTGYAALKLPKNSVGTKQLKKNAVTGSKINKNAVTGSKVKNHSLTGADLNLAALGTVPNAAHAASADNANALGGQPPSAFAANSRVLSSGGVIKVPGTASGNTQTVFSFAPFTVTLTCTKNGSNQVSASLDASSTEDNSVLDGTVASPAGTTENLDSFAPTTTPVDHDNVNYDFEAPTGSGVIIEAALGANTLGTDCWFNYTGVH
jgi:hypothetical protein